VNGPDRLHTAGAPPLPQARRVSALPARVPSGLYPRFHGVARRTSLSSSPGGTPGWTSAAGRPRASDDRRPVVGARGRQTVGMVPRAPLPRRGIVARRPSSPKGRHDGHRREPCFCYTPGAALSAVSHCEARARQGSRCSRSGGAHPRPALGAGLPTGGWQPAQARAVPGGCLLAPDLHWPMTRLFCRGAYGCEVGLPVACGVGWERGGPVGWEVGGPVGWEVGGPVGWERWEDDAPGCGTAAQ